MVPIPNEGGGEEGRGLEKEVKWILIEIVEQMKRNNDDLRDMDEEGLDKEIEEEEGKLEKEEIEERMKGSYQECGPQVEEFEVSMLGLDVEALFPSMTARRTGMIVRERMQKSHMKLEGFNWRMGLVYIRMNRNLTPNIGGLWKLLPFRKKVEGVEALRGRRCLYVVCC